ncbi:MAG TPA: ABC transporter ATP-binding protein [Myxococcota bacterium]|jgi:ABC-2 type transport system ATP-binding protein|nr:ABC transporter ATP-binding protein [Myxococcota bacterium]
MARPDAAAPGDGAGSVPALDLAGVRKRYGALPALDGVDLRVEGGRMGLLGPNGAGKSTLLKSLLGLVTPDAGRIRVLGRDAATDPLGLRARVGYMPENDCLFPGDTAVEATALAGMLSGLPPREAMGRAHEVLYYVGLEEARYRPVADFSTGMRQRVKLAQALVHDPDLLLLDEPTSGMDPAGRDQMLELVVEAWERRGAGRGARPLHLLLSTHLLPDVERTCDRVVLLDRGQVRWSGPLAEMTGSDPRAFAVRVKAREAELAAALRAEGCEVEELLSGELRVRLPGETAASAAGGGGASSGGATGGGAGSGGGAATGVAAAAAAPAPAPVPAPPTAPANASSNAPVIDAELLWRVALDGGWQVRHLVPHRESLEDAFVRLVAPGPIATSASTKSSARSTAPAPAPAPGRAPSRT